MTSAAGLFISVEGIDGAGKSTHVEALAALLAAGGRRVVRTREPGGTALGEALRSIALREAMDPLTEALVMFAARREHVQQVIAPALARGEVVLCDRFTDATFAYQGGGRGFDWQVLEQLERMVQGRAGQAGLLQPDLTLLFELPPEEAARRLAGSRAPDKFEAEPVAFFARVAAAYARRAAADPARFARIDAGGTRESVWAQVRQAVAARGWA